MFYLNKTNSKFDLKHRLKRYVNNQKEELIIKREKIDELVESQLPLYIWGMSRELMYLYEQTELRKCNIIGVIDDIPYKRKFTFDGRTIHPNTLLIDSSPDSALLITATAHIDIIVDKLAGLNYKGDVILV